MFPLVLAAAFALPLSGENPKKEAVAKELKKLEGTWESVLYVWDRKKAEPPNAERRQFILHGEAFTMRGQGEDLYGGAIRADPSKKPKPIDLLPQRHGGKAKGSLAIYELNGDTLLMCIAFPDEPRPSEFTAEPGSYRLLITFRRLKTKR
jgi:uncharacterized protein (TIGR03067 family)